MCRTWSYFWERCGHLTHESSRCTQYPNCPHTPHETVVMKRGLKQSPVLCPSCTRKTSRPLDSRVRDRRATEVQAQIQMEETFRLATERRDGPAPQVQLIARIGSSETLRDEMANWRDGRLRTRIDTLRLLKSRYRRILDGLNRIPTCIEQDKFDRLTSTLDSFKGRFDGEPYTVELLPEFEVAYHVEELIELALCHPLHASLKSAIPNRLERNAVEAKRLNKAIKELLKNWEVGLNALEADERECVICVHRFGFKESDARAEVPIRLPCTHVIGEKCIRRILRDGKPCPLCGKDPLKGMSIGAGRRNTFA